MAHFAKIDENSLVTWVVVVPDDQEHRGSDYLAELGFPGTWLKTSYNTRGGVHNRGGVPFRKNYAGIGYTYDAQRDAFIPPKPSGEGWVLDEETCLWIKP